MQSIKSQNESEGLLYPGSGKVGAEGIVIIRSLAQHQNLFLMKTLLGAGILFVVILASLGWALYLIFRPLEKVQNTWAENAKEYQKEMNQKFAKESQDLQQDYATKLHALQKEGQEGYKSLVTLLTQVQKELEQKIFLLQKEEMNLRQALLKEAEKTQSLRSMLAESEMKVLRLESGKADFAKKEALWKDKIEDYKKQVAALKKQLQEKLTKEELELLKRELSDDG